MRRWHIAITGCLLASAATAQELELKNDGLVDGATAAIQLGFVNGEIGAATFIVDPSMYPLRILRVQLFWKSFFGGAPASVQDAILIYEGPRSALRLIFESDPLQLTDGFLNEFDLAPENIVIQSPPPSNAFTVGMRFSDAPNGDVTKPSLVTDIDGCQPGLNPLFAVPGGWTDLCAFGASGDFVIRCIVEPVADDCYADCDGDGELTFFDFLCYQNLFAAGDLAADCDGDGTLNFFDFLCFQNEFAAGCP
ncbi:MAG: GC-type dockerin domain-anchored protein [Phycisphaerales bacterium JB039]